ncbi:hypothetical protein ABZS53_38490, partial [Streptomyces sp. NPDC005499]|uniref:hypothetical protein n=1 Tax=Streptomyces sp. NPDC005499 TaxID=3154883 RepID=UPI0033B19E23
MTERLVDFDVNELMAAPEHVLGGTGRNLPTAVLSHTCEGPVGVSGGVLADPVPSNAPSGAEPLQRQLEDAGRLDSPIGESSRPAS